MTDAKLQPEPTRRRGEHHRYSLSYRVLHWLMAGGFVILLLAGQQFNLQLSDTYRLKGLMLHSSLGSLVLIAALLLLTKRFIRRDARPDPGLSQWKQWMANIAQGMLYVLAVLVPVTGMATAYFSQWPTPLFGLWNINLVASEPEFLAVRRFHEWATFIAIATVSLHLGAALYHHFVRRDQVLSSMILSWPGRAFKKDVNAQSYR